MDKKRFVTERYNQAEKTTHVVHGNTIIHSVKLTSGDILVEHCICMDPNDFDIEKGLSLCKEKVIKRLMNMFEPVRSRTVGELASQQIAQNTAQTRGETTTTIDFRNDSPHPNMDAVIEGIANQLNRSQRMMR